MATTTSATAEHEHGHPGIVLATLALASFMSVMDLFIRARRDGKLERQHPRRGRRESLAAIPLLHGQRRSRRSSHADRVEQALSDQKSLLADLDSIEGLRLWRDATVALQEDREGRHRCPIGSLVGELSERDPRSRQAFAAAFERWHEAIRHGLERMRELGEISTAADPDSLALAILAVLEGGLLLTQITRSTSRLGQGLDSMIDLIASYRP